MHPIGSEVEATSNYIITWAAKGRAVYLESSNMKFYNGTETKVRKEVERIVTECPEYSVSYYELKGVCSTPSPALVWK